MTNEQFDIIVEKLDQRPGDALQLKNSNVVDWLFKALIAVILYQGVNIKDGQEKMVLETQQIREKFNSIQKDLEYFKNDIDGFDEILDKRFTKDEFDLAVNPLIKQINANTSELNNRSTFIAETKDKLIRLELKINELSEKQSY